MKKITAIFTALALACVVSAETIYFSGNIEGVSNIYELDSNWASTRKITQNTERDGISRRPVPSPDGSRLAYSAPDGEMLPIFILDLQSGKTRKLNTGIGVCSVGNWSADGKSIIYTRIPTGTIKSSRPTDADIFIYDMDTGTESALLESPLQESGPRFSPDGKYVSFSRVQIQNRSAPRVKDADFEIYILDLSTMEERRITENEHHDWAPTWSPAGNELIFASDRNSEHGNGSEIFLLDLNDFSTTQLTKDLAWSNKPSVSSDGKLIAYSYFKASEDPENIYNYTTEIRIFNLTTLSVVKTIDFGDQCSCPEFKNNISNKAELAAPFAPLSLTTR